MPKVIDAHAHCGVIDRSMAQTLEDYQRQIAKTDIAGVALFSPVLEVYDRHDAGFTDSPQWQKRRRNSNAYLLSLRDLSLRVFPYFFIWNDFAVAQITPDHCGIKWHRHPGEPEYHYDDPRCHKALDVIRRKNLPIVLEEELHYTIDFVHNRAQGINVIIPHLGLLNGGFDTIARAGLWEEINVWADTALAGPREIREYIERYGHQRLLFGSDFPFGHPADELHKVRLLELDEAVEAAVLGGNYLQLQDQRLRE